MKHTQDDAGDLLTTLRLLYPTSSTTTLRKMLTQGRVLVNDTVVHRAKHVLEKGDEIEVLQRQRAEERTPSPASKPPVELDVLFEDATLLVVNKPHQLLSVATDRLEHDTLHSRCVEYLQWSDEKAWCYIVHRLDKATSGIMVMAKSKQAKTTSKNNFRTETSTAPIELWLRGAPNRFQVPCEVG